MIIGYTTGVFDMFHIGHLNILRRAKERCDYLIVGVSTDELVQHDKNKTPVIPFEDRCAIVEAIKYVDKVVPQPDKNKLAAWERYHFNKMFVGSDWKGTETWNNFEKQFLIELKRSFDSNYKQKECFMINRVWFNNWIKSSHYEYFKNLLSKEPINKQEIKNKIIYFLENDDYKDRKSVV